MMMRSILTLPDVDVVHLEMLTEAVDLLGVWLAEGRFTLRDDGGIVCADDRVKEQVQQKQEVVNRLSGRVVNLNNYVGACQHACAHSDAGVGVGVGVGSATTKSARDIAMLLLQPKPPAVFDMTLQEVTQIVTLLKVGTLKAYEAVYYRELLQVSLLLPNAVAAYLDGEIEGLPENALPEVVAHKMMADGHEASGILRI